MSYDHMDHAGWLEENIRASQANLTKADIKRASMRKGWAAAPATLNAFQRRAVTILGIMGGGIYNAPINWRTVEWSKTFICLSWRGDLSTIDGEKLTIGVFLAHAAAIRMSIGAHNFREIRIMMHGRQPHRDDEFWHSAHPTLQQAAERFSRRFPQYHSVHWKPEDALDAQEAQP